MIYPRDILYMSKRYIAGRTTFVSSNTLCVAYFPAVLISAPCKKLLSASLCTISSDIAATKLLQRDRPDQRNVELLSRCRGASKRQSDRVRSHLCPGEMAGRGFYDNVFYVICCLHHP